LSSTGAAYPGKPAPAPCYNKFIYDELVVVVAPRLLGKPGDGDLNAEKLYAERGGVGTPVGGLYSGI